MAEWRMRVDLYDANGVPRGALLSQRVSCVGGEDADATVVIRGVFADTAHETDVPCGAETAGLLLAHRGPLAPARGFAHVFIVADERVVVATTAPYVLPAPAVAARVGAAGAAWHISYCGLPSHADAYAHAPDACAPREAANASAALVVNGALHAGGWITCTRVHFTCVVECCHMRPRPAPGVDGASAPYDAAQFYAPLPPPPRAEVDAAYCIDGVSVTLQRSVLSYLREAAARANE